MKTEEGARVLTLHSVGSQCGGRTLYSAVCRAGSDPDTEVNDSQAAEVLSTTTVQISDAKKAI